MKLLRPTLILLLLLVITASCKKAVKQDSNYIGRWLGSSTCDPEIIINPSDYSTYQYRDSQTDCQSGWGQGKARVYGNTLKIGRRKFRIDLAPTLIDTLVIPREYYPHDPPPIPEQTIMKMILYGDTFYKVLE